MGGKIITVYLDSSCRCHAMPADGRISYETDFFDGREELIKYYMIIPLNGSWTSENGAVFVGEMICPAEPLP